MLKPSNQASPQQALRALHVDLGEADDEKIRQIVSLSEKAPDNHAWQTVLQPLRPRLAALRPARALRFTRLLFIPLDDLMVPARHWRPGQATIPRTILHAMAIAVQAELGQDAASIERQIAGRNSGEVDIVNRAGAALWARAAEILAQAPPCSDWPQTGLPLAAYAPLARAVATVLRNASALRSLAREAEVGVLEPNQQTFADILSSLAGQPAEGCAMVFKLILGQFPHAAPLLRRLADAQQAPAAKAALTAAMERGLDDTLAGLETESDLIKELSERPLAGLGAEMARVTTLLRDIGNDAGAARHRPRLRGIRDKLDSICRLRFADGLKSGLAAPLAASSPPIDSASQRRLESCARDLRTVETAGRGLGNPAAYNALLLQAETTVAAAAKDGSLSPVRAVRLIEILSGAEAAEQMYRETIAK
jgi:hypothetical protein